jgi:hypothetical protein
MKRQDNVWVSNDLERITNIFRLADEEDIDEEEQEKENTNLSIDSNRPSLKVNLFRIKNF